MAKKVWKVGKKWAGISKSGKRFMVDTRNQALKLVGKNSTNTTKSTKTKTKQTKTKRRKYLGKKKGTRRKKAFTLPLSIVGAVTAGMADPIKIAVYEKDPVRAAQLVAARYSGVDMRSGTMTFNTYELGIGVGSLIIGGLVHKFVGGAPLNVNRMLGQAGVPIIRV